MMIKETFDDYQGILRLPAGTEFETNDGLNWIVDAEKNGVYEANPHCVDCGEEYLGLRENEQVLTAYREFFKERGPFKIISVPYEHYKEEVLNARTGYTQFMEQIEAKPDATDQ